MNLHLCHIKTSTRDIISNVPTFNTINRHHIFACTLLHHEFHKTCQYCTWENFGVGKISEFGEL